MKDDNVLSAKKSLKSHIKFFETLIKHLNCNDESLQGRAMLATWCLNRYMNNGLIHDIENEIRPYVPSNDPQT
jgi:hypothetical protein